MVSCGLVPGTSIIITPFTEKAVAGNMQYSEIRLVCCRLLFPFGCLDQ